MQVAGAAVLVLVNFIEGKLQTPAIIFDLVILAEFTDVLFLILLLVVVLFKVEEGEMSLMITLTMMIKEATSRRQIMMMMMKRIS